MGERQGGGVVDVLAVWGGVSSIGCEGARGVVDDDIRAVAEHIGLDADR